jgi:hypothetical protein
LSLIGASFMGFPMVPSSPSALFLPTAPQTPHQF